MNLVRLLPVLVLVACTGRDRFRPLGEGDPAPPFSAPTLAGDTVALASLQGQAVLLNIWATWCAPCREEMPELQALHERYAARGLRVLGVSVDERNSADPIRYFVAEAGVTFTILIDPGEVVSQRFRTAGVPETFLIDTAGRIVHRWIGRFEPLSEDALRRVEATLPR